MYISSNIVSAGYKTRKTSVDSSSSSQYSDIDFSSAYDETSVEHSRHLFAGDAQHHDDTVIDRILDQKKPIKITLNLHVTESMSSRWESVLNPDNNILYVALPSVLLPEASKQSFITLLEFAEDRLDVDGVVLCMRKDRHDRPNLVRTFLFLGFQPLSPKSALAPPEKLEEGEDAGNLYLIYNIEE